MSWCCRFCRKENEAEVSTCLCLIFESGGWIVWSEDKKIVLSFPDFQRKFKPSDGNLSNFAWIYVRSPSKLSSISISPSVIEECMNHLSIIEQRSTSFIPAGMKEEVKFKILQTAINSCQKSGKWVIRVKEELVDLVWAKISSAQVKGLLGCGSKVNPPDGTRVHIICVYVQDFTAVADRLRVKNALTELDVTSHIFKPCIFTHLGMNSDNRWKVNVTLKDDYELNHPYEGNHSLEPQLKKPKYGRYLLQGKGLFEIIIFTCNRSKKS